jgi:hypothetical protein
LRLREGCNAALRATHHLRQDLQNHGGAGWIRVRKTPQRPSRATREVGGGTGPSGPRRLERSDPRSDRGPCAARGLRAPRRGRIRAARSPWLLGRADRQTPARCSRRTTAASSPSTRSICRSPAAKSTDCSGSTLQQNVGLDLVRKYRHTQRTAHSLEARSGKRASPAFSRALEAAN